MKSQTTYKLLTSAALAALLVAGCQKDDREKVTAPADQPTAGRLSFDISENGGWSSSTTKAGEPAVKGSTYRSESLLMDCDDPNSPLGDVYIYMVEEDIPAEEPQQEVATRAAEGAEQRSGGLTYGVFAYQGSYPADGTVPDVYNPAATGVAPFQEIQNLQLSADGSYGGAEIYAPGAGFWLQFISYAPYMTVSETDGPNPALYKGTNYPYIKYTATPELAETTDLLFGGRLSNNKSFSPICGDLNTDNEGVTPAIELSFSHILSKVCINSEALSGKITSIKITDISCSGVYNDANSREWTFDPGVQEQEYVYRSTDGSGVETIVEGYYLIPQNLSDNATIEIKVSVPTNEDGVSREYTLTKKLNAFIAEWQPNKQYTYTITTPHEVQITVHDEVAVEGNFPVKKNMTVKNTGLADAYVRVAIVGSWVLDAADGSQYVISDWKESDGTFVWSTGAKPVEGSTNSNSWRLGPDGYYYYMKVLVPGEETKPLFDSYTLTASSPTGGSYLELVILANGVFVPDVQHIFHSDIVNALPN